MTLEELDEKLKKSPYYNGSQAQKLAAKGVNFKGNNVIIPEQLRVINGQIRDDFGNINENGVENNTDYTNILDLTKKFINGNMDDNISYTKFPFMSNMIEKPENSDEDSDDDTNILQKLVSFIFGSISPYAKALTKPVIGSFDKFLARIKALENSDSSIWEKNKLIWMDEMGDFWNSITKNYDNDIIKQDQYQVYKNEDELQKGVDQEAEKYMPDKDYADYGRTVGTTLLPTAIDILSNGTATPVVNALNTAVVTYGDTSDPVEIAGNSISSAASSLLGKKFNNVLQNATSKFIPQVNNNLGLNLVRNIGTNIASDAGATFITDTGKKLLLGQDIDPYEIAQESISNATMPGVLGGLFDTHTQKKLANTKLNSDINTTKSKLQDIDLQINKGDASISKNPKIINKLIKKGQNEIDSLASNQYLGQNKKLQDAVKYLQLAYDTGHIADIKVPNGKVAGLLGSSSNANNGNVYKYGVQNKMVNQMPDVLTKPLSTVKSSPKNDNIVALTKLNARNGDLMIVPMRINDKSNVNNVALNGIYGKDKNSLSKVGLYNGNMSNNSNLMPANYSYVSNNKKALYPIRISDLNGMNYMNGNKYRNEIDRYIMSRIIKQNSNFNNKK